MIKNPEILKKLNIDEKISLVADANTLFMQGNAKAGIRRVNTASWEEVNVAEGNIYPAFGALVNSWNSELISDVAADIALRAKKNSVNLLFTPELRVKSNPYVNGVSEDPYFVRSCIYNLIKAIKSAGVEPCVTGCYIKNSDVRYLDTKMDLRTVREYFFNPYKAVSAFEDGVVTMTSYTKLSGSYAEANTSILSNMLSTIAEKRNGFVVSGECDGDLNAEGAMKHAVSVGGNPSALKQAVLNYNYIKEAMTTGDASGTDMEAACQSYSAVSDEMLGEAVERVVRFSEFVNADKQVTATEKGDRLALSAAIEAIVLLKNRDGLLPLKRKKVAIIGDPAFDNGFAEFFSANCGNEGVEVVGTARGYSLSGDRNETLLAEARAVAKTADVVLLFLGLDKKREEQLGYSERVKFPANRLALADALTKENKNVVAVITTNCQIDAGFDDNMSATLIAPLDCKNSNEALTEILLGVSNPSGKLASTYYADTDKYFTKIKNYKNSGRIKVGGFIGYRYYDAAGSGAKYPFGHGLSYTDFEYSNAVVTPETVEVTVRNIGGYAGSEVVQLYIGKTGTSVIRPLKELKDYKKVFLRPGESKVVKFRISGKLLAVYDEQKKRNITEDGWYEVYIGSSVSDVRIEGKIKVEGEAVCRDFKKHSDYFLNMSNVLTEGYTLKNVKLSGKKGKPQMLAGLIGAGLCALVTCILVALNALGVFDNIWRDTNILGLNDNKFLAVSGLSLLTVFLAFAVVFIAGAVMRKNAKLMAATVKTREPELKNQPQNPFEILFNEEFGDDEPEDEVKPAAVEVFDEEQEALKYIDGTLTLKTACAQLLAYSKSCGVNMDTVTAAKLLAAFASSRLILLRSRNAPLLPELIKVLSGFFCTESYIDEFKNFKTFDGFFANNCASAVRSASELRQNVHIAGLTGVDVRAVRSFFMPLLKYVASPSSECRIKYGYDKTLAVPPNVWFVFGLDNSKPGADDAFILGSAAYVDVNIGKCAPAAEKAGIRFFSYYQLRNISDSLADKFPLDEDKGWKKIDKLEKYVNARSPYRIGNKLWLRAEKFASAILACGGGNKDALDCLTASIFLPAIICQTNGKLAAADESFAGVLDGIFGEDNVQEIKKVLNGF